MNSGAEARTRRASAISLVLIALMILARWGFERITKRCV